ncbi:hypothetical protein STANM309S_05724 [Streptomyces tanashiensis]
MPRSSLAWKTGLSALVTFLPLAKPAWVKYAYRPIAFERRRQTVAWQKSPTPAPTRGAMPPVACSFAFWAAASEGKTATPTVTATPSFT